jgi:2-polyprenyl-6-methoxyphenol hydroxylase-like FAD-dependent oxidoreductase
VVERAKTTGFIRSGSHIDASYDQAGRSHPVRAAVVIGADGSRSTVAWAVRGTGSANQDRIMGVRSYVSEVSDSVHRVGSTSPATPLHLDTGVPDR